MKAKKLKINNFFTNLITKKVNEMHVQKKSKLRTSSKKKIIIKSTGEK